MVLKWVKNTFILPPSYLIETSLVNFSFMTHFQRLENMYNSANYNKFLYETSTITVEKGSATITLDIQEKHHHILNAIHGSVYFKLLDDAAIFSVYSLSEEYFFVTTNFNLSIVRPASKGIIKGIGKVTHFSKRLIIAEATIYDEREKAIAFGTGHFMPSKVRFEDIEAYKGAALRKV